MHEFETFAYLDVQKTGTTFISYILTEFSSEKEVSMRKHGRVRERYDPKKFYFISSRDPLDQYVSLYSHGCGGNGGLYGKLNRKGYGDLYDSTWRGFRRWLSFILDPENASIVGSALGDDTGDMTPTNLIGFQSYRFLELAMLDPDETLGACKSKEDVRKAYKEKNIASFVIHHESFQKDIEELLTTKLSKSIKDLDAAVQFVREGPKLNASDRVDQLEDSSKIGNKNRKALREREWFLHETFGY